MNPRIYRETVESLMADVLNVTMGILTLLPAELDPRSDFARAGGSTRDNEALRTLAQRIDNVCWNFDQIQHCLGLSKHSARFGHPPTGIPIDEDTASPDEVRELRERLERLERATFGDK